MKSTFMMAKMQKGRYTFKCDFSNAVLGPFQQRDSEGYVVAVTNYSIQCKNETIAQGLTGELHVYAMSLYDSDFEDEVYNKEYDRLITIPQKEFEREHGNDEDYGIRYEEMSATFIQINRELDEAYSSEKFIYMPTSIAKMPNVSFKGSYDAYDGASLDDDYADELKLTVLCQVSIAGQTHDLKIKTDDSAFVPSDDAILEMQSFMETSEEE